MTEGSSNQITDLLQAWSDGDEAALEELVQLVYGELRRLAARCLRHQQGIHTLQTTALVNEAYLRLVGAGRINWQNRVHFFAVSAQLMRYILVDFARSRFYLKRGGGAERISLDEAIAVTSERSLDLLALDEALTRLATFDRRQSQVVELRYFGGGDHGRGGGGAQGLGPHR
jgi:RNA polymerase sigma-70 factor, ECF subfamily